MANKHMKVHIAMLEDDEAEALVTHSMVQRYCANASIDFLMDVHSTPESFLSLPLENYDLLFLDILLQKGVTGMDVAKEIRKTNKRIGIVFLTKSTHFAIDGYKVDAIDYIVKPLVYEEFYLKMRKILDVVTRLMDKDILLKTTEGIIKVKESDVAYIEVIKHYLHFHQCDGRVFTVRGTIKDYAQSLSAKFARSGNSFIVNLLCVDRIGSADIYVRFDDGKVEAVPLTRSFREGFLNAFSDYFGE